MAKSTPRRRAEPTRPWSRAPRPERGQSARRAERHQPVRRGAAVPAAGPVPEPTPAPAPVAQTPPEPRPDARRDPVPDLTPPRVRPVGRVTPPPRSRLRSGLLTALWMLLTVAGAGLLAEGLLLQGSLPSDRLAMPGGLRDIDLTSELIPQIGAVAIATTYVWALAARTGGRPVVFSLLTLAVGVGVVAADRPMLRSGAAVMICVVTAVLAIVATVPARNFRRTVREVVLAVYIAAIGGLATVGINPSLDVARFQYVTLGLALLACFAVVYRLGAGFHGLGRRGVFIVVVGALILGLTLAYAELLARYGTPALVEWVFDGIRWLREHLGASPRPIIAFLGIPALVWGTHMRARRRQGWWVCAFGVGATVPIAQLLVNPAVSIAESVLSIAYGVVVGLAVGLVLIRLDLALTGQRGRGARRAEEEAAVRPEPARIEALL